MNSLHSLSHLTNESGAGIDAFTLKRWERDIYNRFREAKKRFPEFFPCFELKNDPIIGLHYSIHFHPLTQYARRLIDYTPQFPHCEEFKPIEQLWNASGTSELDLLFERYPNQLALKPPKQAWEKPWRQLLRGYIGERLEKRNLGFVEAQKNSRVG